MSSLSRRRLDPSAEVKVVQIEIEIGVIVFEVCFNVSGHCLENLSMAFLSISSLVMNFQRILVIRKCALVIAEALSHLLRS